MPPGAFTDDIDLIQVLLAAFLLCFAILVFYLRREDKREGYPLVSRTARHTVIGWPSPPPVKTYKLMDGTSVELPNRKPQEPLVGGLEPASDSEPLRAIGDPVYADLGAGAYVLQRDEPMRTIDGELMLQPLRRASEWSVVRGEADPRGMRALARDYRPVGVVTDLWIDRAAKILRYLEVTLDDGGDTILVPIFFAHIRQADREVRVKALKVEHFAHVPHLRDPDAMTAREEDRLTAYFAGGSIYADALV